MYAANWAVQQSIGDADSASLRQRPAAAMSYVSRSTAEVNSPHEEEGSSSDGGGHAALPISHDDREWTETDDDDEESAGTIDAAVDFVATAAAASGAEHEHAKPRPESSQSQAARRPPQPSSFISTRPLSPRSQQSNSGTNWQGGVAAPATGWHGVRPVYSEGNADWWAAVAQACAAQTSAVGKGAPLLTSSAAAEHVSASEHNSSGDARIEKRWPSLWPTELTSLADHAQHRSHTQDRSSPAEQPRPLQPHAAVPGDVAAPLVYSRPRAIGQSLLAQRSPLRSTPADLGTDDSSHNSSGAAATASPFDVSPIRHGGAAPVFGQVQHDAKRRKRGSGHSVNAKLNLAP